MLTEDAAARRGLFHQFWNETVYHLGERLVKDGGACYTLVKTRMKGVPP